jgi:hypothetical protein
MIEQPTPDTFTPHLHKSFRFAGWSGALRLARIDTGNSRGATAGARPPFTLIFHGPSDDVLPEGLYTAEPETGTAVMLHIMPIHTAAADRQEYQAVFN